MDKKFLKGFLTGLVGTLLVVTLGMGIYFATLQNRTISNADIAEEEPKNNVASDEDVTTKIRELKMYINKFFLNKVDESAYADGVYKGLLQSLNDPYSVYYTKKEYAALKESSSGIYCGIGATVSQDAETGVISIVKPFVNGPAYKAGILPGDIIYKINDEEVTGDDLTKVVGKMKGKKDTKVKVTIMREGVTEPVEYNITRGKIEVPTIESEMLDGKIGYIAISEFDEVTDEQFSDALDKLEKQGLKGLVIDLRNNGGGLLDSVVNMLDRMLPKGKMLVYTKDKYGKGEEFKSKDKKEFHKPLAVLINGNSASASEVFAGAIQDYGLGELVGTTSFGKGIVQTILPLEDETAIKLTTSKYYTPKGRNIHGTGIDPDVKVKLKEGLAKKVEIPKKDDNQLQSALKTVKEKIK